VPFPLALIGAGAAAAIASLLMVPITRLTGAYLAVATLGFSIIVFLFIQNEEWLTGGSYGFIGIPRAELFGYALRDPMSSYYLNVGVAASSISPSPHRGLALRACDQCHPSGRRCRARQRHSRDTAQERSASSSPPLSPASPVRSMRTRCATSPRTTSRSGSRSKYSSWW
jgi:hypothetical protein